MTRVGGRRSCAATELRTACFIIRCGRPACTAGRHARHDWRSGRTSAFTRPGQRPSGRASGPANGAGFNSNGRFYASSTEQLGMTPTAFRSGGGGAAIRFAVGECSLGSVLVAASEKGVCAIFLGDDPDALARDLQDRFPKAQLVGGDAQFERTVAQVIGFIEAPRAGLDLPLDVRGTAFQQKVWRAL